MSDLIQKNITIVSAEVSAAKNGKMVKVHDENNLSYTIWEKKADGSESVAYNLFKMLPDGGIGQNVGISFREDEFETKQGGFAIGRTIVNFAKPGMKRNYASLGDNKKTLEYKPFPSRASQPVGRNWDKEAFGKCKHAYLVEVFKFLLTADNTEIQADEWESKCEDWARRSMRTLEIKGRGYNEDTADEPDFGIGDKPPFPDDDLAPTE